LGLFIGAAGKNGADDDFYGGSDEASTLIPGSRSAFRTPGWYTPLAPPPPSTKHQGKSVTGAGVGGHETEDHTGFFHGNHIEPEARRDLQHAALYFPDSAWQTACESSRIMKWKMDEFSGRVAERSLLHFIEGHGPPA